MRHFLATALLLLSATPGVWAQATDAASDHVFVVGNPSQPFMPNHASSLQAAINKAQPNGTVIIPSSYVGTDCSPISICNPGNVIVVDWRTSLGTSGINCLGAPAIVYQSNIGQVAVCDLNFTTDGAGNVNVVSLTASGAIIAASLGTTGPGGVLDLQLQTPPTSIQSGHIQIYGDTGSGLIGCKNSALTSCLGSAQVIASGTAAMGTAAITSGGCASVVTVSATGTLTTDKIVATANVDPTGVTGYAPSASGSLYIQAWPTANNVNFKVCNNTAGTITPAALTLNWGVFR